MGAQIGALVVKEFVVDRQDMARAIDGGADMVALLARMVGGHQVLAPVLDPFDRAPEAKRCERDQHVLGIELAANAEAAADMPFVEMHRGWAAPEDAGEQVAGDVRYLGGAVELDHVRRRIIAGERPAGLQRGAGMASDRQIELDDQLCAAPKAASRSP